MRRLSALSIAMFATSGAFASGFNLNSPQARALGGTGVSSSSYANPALVSPNRGSKSFDLTLGSVSFYVEDPESFGSSLNSFLEDEIKTYQDFEYSALNESLEDLGAKATATVNEANQFSGNPSQANLGELKAAQAAQVTATSTAQADVDDFQGLVNTTRNTFQGFSNKPINFGLLANLGLQMPRNGVPLAVAFSNNTYGGAELALAPKDLNNFGFVLEDMDGYLEAVQLVNVRLAELIAGAEEYEETGDSTRFDDAQTDFDVAVTNLNSFSNDPDEDRDGLFQNGTVNDQADILTFDAEAMKSTIDVLGANISELAVGSGVDFPNALGNLSVGATAKLQYVMVFGEVFGMDDTSQMSDPSFIQNNTKIYFSGNLDVGASQSFVTPGFGTVAVGAVVKDVVPQSFESADGRPIEISPKASAGVSHQTRFTRLSVDIDLTENDPIGFGVKTRYLGVGAELNAWDQAQLRLGYRNNLALENASIVSAGIGLTPWIAAVNLSGWVKPDASDAFDFGLNSGASLDVGIRF